MTKEKRFMRSATARPLFGDTAIGAIRLGRPARNKSTMDFSTRPATMASGKGWNQAGRLLAAASLTLWAIPGGASTILGGATSSSPVTVGIGGNDAGCSNTAGSNAYGAIVVGCTASSDITDPTNFTQGLGLNGGIVIGNGAGATGANDIALGSNTQAHSDSAVAIGIGTSAGVAGANVNNTIAIGVDTKTTANNAIALGTTARATGDVTVAIGGWASASQANATAIGPLTSAAGIESTAIGYLAAVPTGKGVAIGSQSLAEGGFAVALGSGARASAPGTTITTLGSPIAIGANANASGTYGLPNPFDSSGSTFEALAIGNGANATGQSSTALGWASSATGLWGTAVGGGTAASGARGTAVGVVAQASAPSSLAVGYGAVAAHAGSVALGAESATTVGARTDYVAYALAAPQTSAGEVSIGSAAAKRQITGVAAGSAPTDAVNVSQLNQVGQNTADSLGGGATYDATTGAYTGPTYTVNGQTYHNVGDAMTAQHVTVNKLMQGQAGLTQQENSNAPITVGSNTGGTTVNVAGTAGDRRITGVADGAAPNDAATINQLNNVTQSTNGQLARLNNRVDSVENRAKAGIAAAMAMASLPQAYMPSKSMLSFGGGTWNGESGYAIGLSAVSDNGSWVVKLSGATSSRGDYGGAVGVGYQW